MRFDELNKENFLLFAIKYYENPTASTQEEFEEDLKRFKYVKRWLKRYHDSGDINSHLLLNHIIIILNCWDDAAIPMFFHKIESTYWPYLKAFLSYLDKIPQKPVTSLHFIEEDQRIIRLLEGTTDEPVTRREKAKAH
jgi:hypothetical protein